MKHRLPPYTINEQGELSALAETKPQFLSQRGDFRKLKEITGNGQGIKIGIGDTGVDRSHLEGDLVNVVEAKDFTGSRFGAIDRNMHGSHVTCHIGAKRDQNGIEGIASESELYHAKVLGDSGSGSSQGIARGIMWLADQGCKIINLSLGGGYSEDIEQACKYASEQGVLVFAALGNDGNRRDGHPGNSRYTFGVAAVDYNMQLANFSSRSDKAIFAGYGVNVLSCSLNGQYARISGTSMATPDQAGIAGLICSYMEKVGEPVVNMSHYWDIVKPAVVDLGPEGWDRGYGFGFIDIWKVLELNPIKDTPVDPPEQSECEIAAKRVTAARIANRKTSAELEAALDALGLVGVE